MECHTKRRQIDLIDLLIYIYALLIPIEDVLQVAGGTLLKYIAIAIIVLSMISNRYIITDSLYVKGNGTIYYLLFLSAISIIWSINKPFAYAGILKCVMLMGFTIAASVRMRSAEKIRKLENVFILGGIISVVYILATQNISEIMQQESISAEAYRITTSSASDANGSAARLLLPFSISTWKCVDRSENAPRFKLFYLMSSFVLSIFMLLTGSRTALIAILAVLLIYIFLGFQHSVIRNTVIIVLMGFLVYTLISQFMPEKLFNRLFSIERYDLDAQSNSRTQIWENVFQYVLPSMPPWGFGIGNSPVAMYSVAGYYQGVHNTYLSMLMEFGIFGIPAFLCLLISMLKKLLSHRIIVGFASMVGLMIVMMFIDVYRVKFMWAALLYFMILIENVKKGEVMEDHSENTSNRALFQR